MGNAEASFWGNRLKAGIFTSYENRSHMIKQLNGTYSYEQRIRREDVTVTLKMPEEGLEIGETYNLIFGGDNFSVKASLIKEKREEDNTNETYNMKEDKVSNSDKKLSKSELNFANNLRKAFSPTKNSK